MDKEAEVVEVVEDIELEVGLDEGSEVSTGEAGEKEVVVADALFNIVVMCPS